MNPRCVLVRRPTEYEELLARHGTREQLRFFLAERGRTLEELAERHEAQSAALRGALGAIPRDWRRATVTRAELDRFLFAPDDVVVVVGQDGLVANVAKYLDGQPVIGLNPEPERWPGVLVPHPPAAAADLLRDVAAGWASLEHRPRAAVGPRPPAAGRRRAGLLRPRGVAERRHRHRAHRGPAA